MVYYKVPYWSTMKALRISIVTNGYQIPETSPCSSGSQLNLTHHSSARPHSPPQMATQSLHTFSHRNATNSPLVTMGHPITMPKITPPHETMCTPIYTAHPCTHGRPTTPNGIQIHTANFLQITGQTDTQTMTDRLEKSTQKTSSNNRLLTL